jgi:lipoprotein NlpI
MLRAVVGFALSLAVTGALAAEPPIPADERSAMLAAFRADIVALNQAIEKSPREVPLYSHRGDRHLFLGQFAQAVADFEKMIALDPAQDAPHWRLGIAYYFAGQFVKSAKQFEKYHAHDGTDRENGIWKFLGDVKTLGLEPARRVMLGYTRFDREPFPSLYAMFAGKTSTAAFLADLDARKLSDNPRVMFFADYYAGLHEELLGQREEALALLHKAVANPWARAADREPTYMWQIARLHYETLAKAKP